jgi:hypothetical protein
MPQNAAPPPGIPYQLLEYADGVLGSGNPRNSFAALHAYQLQGGDLSKPGFTPWSVLLTQNMKPQWQAELVRQRQIQSRL